MSTRNKAPSTEVAAVLAYLQNRLPAYPFNAKTDRDFVEELVEDFGATDVLDDQELPPVQRQQARLPSPQRSFGAATLDRQLQETQSELSQMRPFFSPPPRGLLDHGGAQGLSTAAQAPKGSLDRPERRHNLHAEGSELSSCPRFDPPPVQCRNFSR